MIERKVLWVEGAFLRPQHFQQQDRRAASVLAERTAMVQPFYWGFSRLKISEKDRISGKIALEQCCGAFPDGEPFASEEMAGALSLEIPADTVNETVYLIAPEISGDAALAARTAPGAASGARYVLEDVEVKDALHPGPEGAAIEIGLCNARLVLESDRPTAGHVAIPAARVLEVGVDRAVRLDPDFIPAVTRADASPVLGAILEDVATRLNARADALASNVSQVGALGDTALKKLMMLRVANGKGALFDHLSATGAHHPERIYRECLELAGELCAFSKTDRRAPEFPTYDHDNLALCFAPVVETIRRLLAEMIDDDVFQIDLTRSNAGGFYGPIQPADLLPDGRFIVVARCQLDAETFRDSLPRQTKIASVNRIMDYTTSASGGARLEPLAVVPRELEHRPGWTYFEIRHDAEVWDDIVSSRSIAIYEANAFPELTLELWGIRSRK